MKKQNNPCIKAPLLLQKGETKRGLENLDRCKRQIRKNIRKSKSSPELVQELNKQMIRAIRLELETHYSLAKISKVRSTIQEAKKYFSQTIPDGEILALKGYFDYSNGTLELLSNDFEAAVGFYEKSKDSYLKGKHFVELSNVSFRIADLALKANELELCEKQFQDIKKSVRKIKQKKMKSSLEAKQTLLEGKLNLERNESKRAQALFAKARKQFSKAKDPGGEAQSIIELSNTYSNTNLKKTEEYLLEGLDLAKVSNSPLMQGIILTRLGVISLKSGRFEEGKERLLKGLKFRTEAGDKSGTASSLLELSRISLLSAQNSNDYKRAQTLAIQALDLYNEIQDLPGKSQVLEVLATISIKLENYQEAEKLISQSRKIFQQFNDTNGEARTLTQLGIIVSHQNKSDATPIFNKAVKLYQKIDNKHGIGEIFQLQAELETDQRVAISLYEKCLVLYEKLNLDKTSKKIVLDSIKNKIQRLETELED